MPFHFPPEKCQVNPKNGSYSWERRFLLKGLEKDVLGNLLTRAVPRMDRDYMGGQISTCKPLTIHLDFQLAGFLPYGLIPNLEMLG